MLLAHVAQSGGPHTEYLILAGGFLLLGLVLFAQKSVKPVFSIGLILLAVALGTGAFVLNRDPSAGDRIVVITEPKPGDVVEAKKPIPIEVNVTDPSGGSDSSPKGHIHVFVDGNLVAMPAQIDAASVELDKGDHTLSVEYVTGPDHKSFNPKVIDEIEISAR
ncbi:MAG: hypothetical protein M3285_12665 [Actinomycetota bacterium]|nr:hypothetical protein [Actinomycetota bacterium]